MFLAKYISHDPYNVPPAIIDMFRQAIIQSNGIADEVPESVPVNPRLSDIKHGIKMCELNNVPCWFICKAPYMLDKGYIVKFEDKFYQIIYCYDGSIYVKPIDDHQ